MSLNVSGTVAARFNGLPSVIVFAIVLVPPSTMIGTNSAQRLTPSITSGALHFLVLSIYDSSKPDLPSTQRNAFLPVSSADKLKNNGSREMQNTKC